MDYYAYWVKEIQCSIAGNYTRMNRHDPSYEVWTDPDYQEEMEAFCDICKLAGINLKPEKQKPKSITGLQIPARMNRKKASEYLLNHWNIKRTPNTLSKLAVIGGGPQYQKCGLKQVLYTPDSLDKWAQSILSPLKDRT